MVKLKRPCAAVEYFGVNNSGSIGILDWEALQISWILTKRAGHWPEVENEAADLE